MIKPIVKVNSPARNVPRKGRGFSEEELSEADISLNEARGAGLLVDLRRSSKYDENVEILKKFKIDYKKYQEKLEDIKAKVRKENIAARKEAESRKKTLDASKIEEEKRIQEEMKKVQEEIERRESEEIKAEAAKEELTEKELAEIETVEKEEEVKAPIPLEKTPEEALEKVEEDLAKTLGIKEEKPVAEGTKRVIKRVRKKPVSTTKGVSEKAEKKE